MGEAAPSPPWAKGLSVEEVAVDHRPYGVAHDRRAMTVAASIRVAGASVAAIDSAGLAQCLDSWERVLSVVSASMPEVTTLQHVTTCWPADNLGLQRELDLLIAAGTARPGPALANHRSLLEQCGPVATDMGTVVSVQCRYGLRRSFEVASAMAVRAAGQVARALSDSGWAVRSDEPLSATALAAIVRHAHDPRFGDQGCDPAHMWPTVAECRRGSLDIDGTRHVLMEARFPERPVLGDLLHGAVLNASGPRAVSVLLAPLPRDKEVAALERRRTSRDASDMSWWRRLGFRRAKHDEAAGDHLEGYAEQVIAGHAPYKAVAFADVISIDEGPGSGPSGPQRMRQQSAPLGWEQAWAAHVPRCFTAILPFGRGLHRW